MDCRKTACTGIGWLAALLAANLAVVADTPTDLSAYQKDCEVRLEGWNGHLRLAWPSGAGEDAVVMLDLSGGKPLIESLAIRKAGETPQSIITGVDPVWF